jgi:hypothetical protein
MSQATERKDENETGEAYHRRIEFQNRDDYHAKEDDNEEEDEDAGLSATKMRMKSQIPSGNLGWSSTKKSEGVTYTPFALLCKNVCLQ